MDQPSELQVALDADADADADAARASAATAQGAQAFARLLRLAETRDSGQVRRVVRFLAASFDGEAYRFDLFDLRAVDTDISEDMLQCLDALRWARADLHKLVPDGAPRVRAVLTLWGLCEDTA